MNTISKIEYIDPMYFMTEACDPLAEFVVHEAYGYKTEYKEDILLTFIQRSITRNFFKKVYQKVFWYNHTKIPQGLLVPRGLLVSRENGENTTPCVKMLEGVRVSVVWRDVVYLENVPMRASHTMRSTGVLWAVKNDRIVLHFPHTIRIKPHPQKQHAKDALYLVIPRGCIEDIQICK
jgi:hypothetical protein